MKHKNTHMLRFTLIILQLMLFSYMTAPAQDPFMVERKVDFMLTYGLSGGAQGWSIPPLANKISAGARYSFNDDLAIYVLPGVTFGLIGPYAHLEAGAYLENVTMDYSFSIHEWKSRNVRNHNFNLGYLILLNPGKTRDVFLWLKGGKSFSESGYTADYQPQWNGWNAELKVLLPYRVLRRISIF